MAWIHRWPRTDSLGPGEPRVCQGQCLGRDRLCVDTGDDTPVDLQVGTLTMYIVGVLPHSLFCTRHPRIDLGTSG